MKLDYEHGTITYNEESPFVVRQSICLNIFYTVCESKARDCEAVFMEYTSTSLGVFRAYVVTKFDELISRVGHSNHDGVLYLGMYKGCVRLFITAGTQLKKGQQLKFYRTDRMRKNEVD